jgi:hypothetical protein
VLEVIAIAVIFVIFAVMAAAGAWPTPDVNEAAYLTKARHAADPSWCAGDFYLETPDAHGIFYLVMGPLAARMPLDTAAWIGRVAGWLALAIGFWHLAVATVTGPGWSPVRRAWATLVAAAIFSLALRQTTAAGEWVIGGCEAKVFAWALVFGGLGELVRGRFATAWCLLGGATAFHPLVGGWSMVAATAAVVVQRPWPSRPSSWSWTAVLGIAAGLFAACGVVPAVLLNAGVDAATQQAAATIYVVERLPHHLLVHAFATGFVARHVLAVVVWWLLRGMVATSPARRWLDAFTLAALSISLAGVLIALAEPWVPSLAHGLLRYYWFRLGDVAVPLALAIVAATVLADDAACRRIIALSPRGVRAIVTALLLLDLAGESQHWPLPGREVVSRADTKVDAPAWVDICEWVRDHAPPDAVVLTPRGAATLTWRTGRREVVSWKNVPQDALSLVAWRKRLIDCFSIDGTMSNGVRSTATLGPVRMAEVVERYGATLAIVPLDTVGIDELPYRRLHANDVYAVYDLTR